MDSKSQALLELTRQRRNYRCMGATGILMLLPHPVPGDTGRKIYVRGGPCCVLKHSRMAPARGYRYATVRIIRGTILFLRESQMKKIAELPVGC